FQLLTVNIRVQNLVRFCESIRHIWPTQVAFVPLAPTTHFIREWRKDKLAFVRYFKIIKERGNRNSVPSKCLRRCKFLNPNLSRKSLLSAGVYRPMLRYAWQNAGYDI
ncbi:hypothetical protein L9F63_009234, partial [Diploptera punctata]